MPPPALGLLESPLDFIAAEHARMGHALDRLEALADGAAAAPAAVAALQHYLGVDLALHVADEERDLFPLLRRRARPGDDIEFILALLASEHLRDQELARAAAAGLAAQAPGGTGDGKAALAAFAATQRRHVAWESTLIMPRARQLLPPADLAALGRSLARRRGRRPAGIRLRERLAALMS